MASSNSPLLLVLFGPDGTGDNNQWWASSCTSSASKNARYASAPAPDSPCVDGTSEASARVGSVASYAASSEARSGSAGAEGADGAENAFTTPT
jgi:hypothetical protein